MKKEEITFDEAYDIAEDYVTEETLHDMERLGRMLNTLPGITQPDSFISFHLPYYRIQYLDLRARVPKEFPNSYLLRRDEGDVCHFRRAKPKELEVPPFTL